MSSIPISKTSIILFLLVAILCSPILTYATTDAQEQLDFAHGLFARQMYTMAISEYEKFIAKNLGHPEEAKAYFLIGESLFGLKEYAKAIEKYNEYIAKFPNSSDVIRASLNINLCNIELKNYAAVTQNVTELLKGELDPERKSEAFYLLGLALLGDNKKEEGLLKLQAATEAGSNRYAAAAAYRLGSLYWQEKDFQKAENFFKKSADTTDDVETKQLSLLGLFEAELKLSKYDEALKGFNQIIADEKVGAEIKEKAILGALNVFYSSERNPELINLYNEKKDSISSAILKFQAGLLVAQAYSKGGKYDEALASLDLLLKNESIANEQRDTALLEKATVLLMSGKVAESKSILESSDKNIDMARYLLLKAEASYYGKEFAEAIKHYEAITNNYADSAQSRSAAYGIAHAMLKNGQKQDARNAFLKFFEKYPKDKQASMALYSAVLLDNELGLKSEGVNDAKTYIERYPNDNNAKEVRFILGRLYTDLNNMGSAIRLYQEYEASYPDDKRLPDVHYLIGHNFSASGNIEKSNSYYAKITRQQNSNLYYSAQKNIIQNYLTEGKEFEAAQVLFALMKDFAENDLDIDTFIWTAKMHIDAKQYDAALEIIRLAEPKKKQANRNIELAYYRGESLRGLGKYDEAINAYNECMTEDKEKGGYTGPSLVGIGLCLKGKGAVEEAIKSFEKAIEFNPEDSTVAMNARYQIAESLMQQNKYEDAAKMFMLVTILYDDKRFAPDALYGAAVAFHKAGKEREATKAYQDIVKNFPSYEKIDSLKKALEEK